jgi:hypothetical protein
MNRVRALAVALVLSGCDTPADTPKAAGPTVSEVPSIEERILVCETLEESIAPTVFRCVTSEVDQSLLSDTLFRWGRAQGRWSDLLLDTVSFKERFTLRDAERDCLRRAFCRLMPFEER